MVHLIHLLKMDYCKNMKKNIIVQQPADLTVAWAQRVVEQHNADTLVNSVNIVAVDVGTTTRISIAVDHDGPASIPDRWFVKLPSLSWRARMITALPRLLHNEVRFYKEVAHDVPLNMPFCLAAESQFLKGSTLVLADVAIDNNVPGIPSDTLTVPQAAVVIEQLARIHAKFWNNLHHDNQFRWLAGTVRTLEDALGSALAVPLMKRGLRYAKKLIPGSLYSPALHYARHRRTAMRFLSDAPHTLIHHDCHPGNLFWYRDQSKVGFLDWQLVRIGEGVSDVAYFLSTALCPKMRKTHDAELLQLYVETLAKHNITNIDYDQLMGRYRAHLVYAFEAMIVTLAIGGMMNLSCNHELVRRTALAVDDLDAFSALPI